jgi:hypothetical protein
VMHVEVAINYTTIESRRINCYCVLWVKIIVSAGTVSRIRTLCVCGLYVILFLTYSEILGETRTYLGCIEGLKTEGLELCIMRGSRYVLLACRNKRPLHK